MKEEDVQGYVRLGRGPTLSSIDDVAEWASRNGGELAVRVALADGKIGHMGRDAARLWLEIEERKRMMEHDRASLIADQRAAVAAERAARWAMWSAIVSAVTAIAAALWTVFNSRITAWISSL